MTDHTDAIAVRDKLDGGRPATDGRCTTTSTAAAPTLAVVRDWWSGRPLWSPPRMPDEFVQVLWEEIDRLTPGTVGTIEIPKPEIHTGPKHLTVDQATTSYLREAASRVRAARYWGSGVTALVADLIDSAAAAIEARQ